jgi:hypothetical protein
MSAWDFIKIKGYAGSQPIGIPDDEFESFQGLSGTTGTGTGQQPAVNVTVDMGELLDIKAPDSLINALKTFTNNAIFEAEGEVSAAGLPIPIRGIAQFIPQILALIAQFGAAPLPLMLLVQTAKNIIEILAVIRQIICSPLLPPDVRTANALERGFVEGNILSGYKSILSERLKEIKKAIDDSEGDSTVIIAKLQALVDVLKKALVETVGGQEQSILRNWLEKLEEALQALKYNDEVVDFGFLRVLLKGKVIEY